MSAPSRLARLGGLLVALLGACTTGTDRPPSTPRRPTGAELPDTPAGGQLDWVLTEGATADNAQLAEGFSADFLAAVPAGELRAVLADLV